jgi:diguanylate cyclase (GGDEF)-like protein
MHERVSGMRRFFEISSYRGAARISAAFIIAAEAASLTFGEAVARLIGQPADWKHYVLSVVIPLILVPLIVVPLVGVILRLNILRAEMSKLAGTDVLTGLMNRRAFFEECARSLASGSTGTAMMMIDVDRFKLFNDTHGHDAGDAVLATMARTLTNTLLLVTDGVGAAGESHLARIGGEEFALLVTRISPERAERLAAAICAQVRATPCRHRGNELQATVSIGLALGSGAETVEQLLKAADTAVYEAKHAGRDRWCMATQAMTAGGKGVSHALRAHPRAA